MGNFIFHIETIDPMPADIREQYEMDMDALASEIYDTRFEVDENGNATTGYPAGPQWYRSVLAVAEFRGAEAVEIRFHPIELGWRMPRSQRGTPRLAPEPLAREIIEHWPNCRNPSARKSVTRVEWGFGGQIRNDCLDFGFGNLRSHR
ncbi:MAG: hypothetical protein CM1200mP36_03770 [Gammaproteobacteria bacterium]|nr:MAG: hypothetical protein CM1200mP36_03770 [Gammaproteobacteria bacterium]